MTFLAMHCVPGQVAALQGLDLKTDRALQREWRRVSQQVGNRFFASG